MNAMKYFKFDIAAISDVGIQKDINQDCYVYRAVSAGEEQAAILAVADGVGGMDAGEKASSMAIASLNHWWETTFRQLYNRPETIRQSLELWLKKANKSILAYARQNNLRMGTTISVLLLYKGQYHLIHVGDSRIYKLPRGLMPQLARLTQDHATVIQQGGRRKWVLTHCLGYKDEFDIFYACGTIKTGDIYLLCTDGLYKTASEKELAKMIKKATSLTEALHALINSVKANGETDNITAILAKAAD